jgi:DNA-directed RNA polymerase specialized sigma24 family protein
VPGGTPNWDAQDARDRELLARGAIEELLAAYVDLIRARCRNRCGAHGDDVAQQACLRLWRELSDGKHRNGAKPFREIVNGVVAFACKGWEGTTLGRDAPLEEWTTEHAGSAAGDVAGEAMTRIDFEAFVDSLSAGDGEVARLRLIELLEIDQIAEMTGKTRNAVDQALFRIRRQWKTWLES